MVNQMNTGQTTISEQIKTLSDEQLKMKIGELAMNGEDFSEYKNEIEARKNRTSTPENSTNNLQEIADILDHKQKGSLSGDERERIKKILQNHLQTQKNGEQQLKNTTNATIADLTAQLNDSNSELNEQKKAYNELLDADEKIITPAEYTRRRRLRSIRKKFIALRGNPPKALAYFITKTSFWKGGKATASIKKGVLFMKSISSFSTMGMQQLERFKENIQNAIDDIAPNTKEDTITTQHLKKGIIEEVVNTTKLYFERITKPIDVSIKTPN